MNLKRLFALLYPIYVTVGLLVCFSQWSFSPMVQTGTVKRAVTVTNCTLSIECGHGTCEPDGPVAYACKCEKNWISRDGTCNYEQKQKLSAFLASFFGGGLGADWFYLCRDNGLYIFAGIMKLLTLGMVGIWWTVDWIRVVADGFLDGNGVELGPW